MRQAADRVSFEFGIRTIQTVQFPPVCCTLDMWKNASAVLVNGQSSLLKASTGCQPICCSDLTPLRYAWLLDMARNAGFQMLRVWGGGLVGNPRVLPPMQSPWPAAWQDFPLRQHGTARNCLSKCGKRKLPQNVFRLRNHPSLAVWCGGNEFNAYAPGNAAPIGIFERTVVELDGTHAYRRTSPDTGGLHQYPDMDPTWYYKTTAYCPFMAETGMHNIPEARSMREVVVSAEFEKPLREHVQRGIRQRSPRLPPSTTLPSFLSAPSRVPRMLSWRLPGRQHECALHRGALGGLAQIGASEFYQILSEQLQ